jgi:hypothetical protein
MSIRDQLLVVSAKSFPDQVRVVNAWLSNGGSVLRVDRFWEPPPLERQSAVLFGTQPFCIGLSSCLGLELVSPPEDFLLELPLAWVGRGIWPMTLGAAADLVYPIFLKPLEPKLFTAAVYNSYQDLLFQCCGLSEATEIMAAEVVEFSAEFRVFILNGDVVAHGCYMGKADDQAMLSFARRIALSRTLPETCVIDVGFIPTRGWVVVEANPVWCAALRGCSPDLVVRCIAVATSHFDEEAGGCVSEQAAAKA